MKTIVFVEIQEVLRSIYREKPQRPNSNKGLQLEALGPFLLPVAAPSNCRPLNPSGTDSTEILSIQSK